MSIAGFAKYMEYIGVSKSLFTLGALPIKHIKSSYILLVFSFFISQVLVVFIPSHAGLGLLLMVMLYRNTGSKYLRFRGEVLIEMCKM
jgi:DcuC family C4-dicarboxylate transporter